MDTAMTNELHLTRRLGRFALALGLSLAGAAAYGQDAPSPPAAGVAYPAPAPADAGAPDSAAPAATPARHSRGEIRPYLEVAQVLDASLDHGGDTLTYTSVAAGVDGHVETRRVTAQMSLRYERNIDWNGHVAQQDELSGIGNIHAEVAPGLLALDAGALATRTGGAGRVFGLTGRDRTIDVYSVYAGPTLAAHSGPVAINGAYRFGYTKIDDNTLAGRLNQDFDSSTEHDLTASIGMGTRSGLPFGWTVGAGYVRETTGGRWDQRFQGSYVRGDVVVPVGPTLAVTAGVGYERIRSSQRDAVRDASGAPVVDASGQATPNPGAPRLLTYDMDGVMYDGGILWRPSPRTELQARAGHRYGGTTFVGSFSHQVSGHAAVNAAVYDMVETFGHQLTSDLSSLPTNFNPNRDPLTGGLSGCVFGATGGLCFDRALQSITGNSFRARGASIAFSGERGLWSYGVGAGYNHRRYFRPGGTAFATLGATEDKSFGIYGSLGRRLSRTSEVDFSAYASWYDNDEPGFASVTTEGASLSYNRTFMLEHLHLLAALGLNHNDGGTDSSTNASALAGLRYTF
jgi:hypothetical protein